MMDKLHPAYQYALWAKKKSNKAPKYVRLQAIEFLKMADGKSEKYFVYDKKVKFISNFLKLLKMAKGLKAGMTVYDALSGYQWFLIIAVFCCVHRDNPKKRRYTTVVLEIARKNAKTFLVGLIFIILIFIEPKFSYFYSVAPDGSLSREVKKAIEELLKSSPDLECDKNFKIRRDDIFCKINNNTYIPLSYSTSRLDGKLPNAFLADEVGALPTNYALEAMRSGQATILNKIGFIISTKYPTIKNPFETEISTVKDSLDGIKPDAELFGLLFEPDNPKKWQTDDTVLRQANPLSYDLPEFWNDLLKKRDRAIAYDEYKENFLTKHCNIIYQGEGTETYIDAHYVQACEVAEGSIDWKGRDVYLGVDLSITTDNTSVAMAGLDDDGDIIADDIAFIPEGRIEAKNAKEKIDYREFINACKCIACGDEVIDYAVVEKFVFDIEEKYGVTVCGIGCDRANCMSSAQKWDEKYEVTMVKQHSSVLHPATKLLKEYIMNKKFKFEKNTLLKLNFQNAKCSEDANRNKYVHKKKSSGKVDMVVALINAVYMLNEKELLNQKTIDWGVIG